MLDKIVDGRTDLVFDWIAGNSDPHATDENGVSGDHGAGWRGMDQHLLGAPHP